MDVYIGVGTNLGDLWSNLRSGLEELERSGLPALDVSSVWETEAVDTPRPGLFLNLVLRSESDRPPLEVLDRLLAIEQRAGRVREVRNGPRVLDLDFLMMGGLSVGDPRLRLPHPRMWERRFVLEPLAEIAPQLANPATGRSVAETCRLLGSRPFVRKVGHLAPARTQSV